MKASASGLPGNIDVSFRDNPYCPLLVLKIPSKMKLSTTVHNQNFEPAYEQLLGNVELVFLGDVLSEFVAAPEPTLKAKLKTVQQLKSLLEQFERVIDEAMMIEELG